MRSCRDRSKPLLLAALAGAALALIPLQARGRPGDPRIDPDGYTSARVCGECHTDIYESWKKSLHAFSLTDPIFDASYMQAVRVAGDRARRVCLRCHAPMTLVNEDLDLSEGVTREGVSCDFCHTVTAVHLDRPEAPYSVDLGEVKRSVLKQAESPAHAVAYSELHGTAEFCGGCHNYRSPSGATIMGTYEEWKDGPYAAEGVTCQDCHMALTEGKVARQAATTPGQGIHLHSLIHHTDQIRSAVAVRIVSTRRQDEQLSVDVEVENVGSGHMIPTGIPSRELVLTVTASTGDRSVVQERRYRKIVADESNRPLEHDFEALLHGAKVLNDNRIGPREKRLERFTFRARKGQGVRVSAALSYVYSPVVISQQHLNIRLDETERVVY